MKASRYTLALPAMLAAASANAQIEHQIAVSAGFNLLSNSNTSDVTAPGGFVVGLSYYLPKTILPIPHLEWSLDANWARNSGNGNHIDTAALEFAARYSLMSGGMKGKSGFLPYVGLGVGVVRNQLVGSLTTSFGSSGGTITNDISDTNVTIGGKALIGCKLTPQVFLEGAYNWNGTVSGYKADTVTVVVGYRF